MSRRETPAAVTLLKLGGSLITDKERPDTARPEVIRRLADEIVQALSGPGDPDRERAARTPIDPEGLAAAPSGSRLVLGHGSGSFGHAAAARLGVPEGASRFSAAGPEAVSRVQERAAALHRQVVDALLAEGASPFSVAPSSALVASGGPPVRFEAEPLLLALRAGLLPVVYGDLVMDRERGWAIASTEAVFLALAEELGRRGVPVERALWAGATDGVLAPDGRRLDEVRPEAAGDALAAAGGAAAPDVTGGMRLRLEAALELARRGVPSLVFDGSVPGRVAAALRGEPVPGTRVVP